MKGENPTRRFKTKREPLDFSQFQQVILRDLRKITSTSDSNFLTRKYDSKQIANFLLNPYSNEKQLIEVSHHLYATSGSYMRLIQYFATMLTFDYVLVPMVDGEKINQNSFKRALSKVNKYLDGINIKYEMSKIMPIVMTEDTYFGIKRTDNNKTVFQRLPYEYCRISHVVDGSYGFNFDMTYFDAPDRKDYLEQFFPAEFAQMYADYKVTRNKWQPVDDSIAVCFKFNSNMVFNLPPLVGTFEDLLYLDGAKALSYTENLLSNYRLLVQQIPMRKDAVNEGDMLFTLPTAAKFHENVKSALPDSVGLATTPMTVSSVPLERSGNKELDKVERAENNVFMSAGASHGLFNSTNDNSISLNRGIEVDSGLVFNILKQVQNYFNKELKAFSTGSIQFKLIFPDITIYNRNDMADAYKNDCQFGMPKSFLAAARGYTTSDMINLLAFENDFLNLTDSMEPLKSSHVASNNDSGRPEEKINDLTPSGAKTRTEGGNDNRAQ